MSDTSPIAAGVPVRIFSHPSGFTKLVLSGEPDGEAHRIHVWDDHLPDTIDIHQHRASFTSTVIEGSMNEELWRYADDPDGGWERMEADCRTGSDGQYRTEQHGPLVRCRVEPVALLTHKAGETYERDAADLHRIFPVRLPLVTLVRTGPVTRRVHTIIRRRPENELTGRNGGPVVLASCDAGRG